MSPSDRAGGSRVAARPASFDDMVGLLRFQQSACRDIGSAIYDRLVGHIIVCAERPGPTRDLLGPHICDPFGSALALRFLGSVHRLVLEGRVPELALHYPSVGGRPGRDLETTFEKTVGDHFDELAVLIDRGVQTNEVGRSASLLGGLLEAGSSGLPLRVFELGASAGLNLRWDRYRYVVEGGGQSFGPIDSALSFVNPWTSRSPDLGGVANVVERRGCDRAPIDSTCEVGRLVLRSFIWPDLVERFARLDAAIEVARAVEAPVDQADAVDWAEARLAEPEPGTATVVMHSIVLQYMAPDRRAELLDLIASAGARASTEAPLAWLRMEPGRDNAEVRITTWPGGATRLLATSTYHGPPVTSLG